MSETTRTATAMEAFMEGYFANAVNWPAKLFWVGTSTVHGAALCAFFAAMVAVEKSYPENQRTITVRLTSTVFVHLIVRYVVFLFPRNLQMLTGPWPRALCHAHMFADVYLMSAVITLLAIIAILKAFFLMYFKNVWALQDDFWLFFFHVWLAVMCSYAIVPMVTLPGTFPTYHTICVGGDYGGNDGREVAWKPNRYFSRVWLQLGSAMAFAAAMGFMTLYRFFEKAKASLNKTEEEATRSTGCCSIKRLVNAFLILIAFAVSLFNFGKIGRDFTALRPSTVGTYYVVSSNVIDSCCVAVYLRVNPRMRGELAKRIAKVLRIQR